MNLNTLSPEIQEYLTSLLDRNVINSDSLLDKMFINYISTQRFDKDYLHASPNCKRNVKKAC